MADRAASPYSPAALFDLTGQVALVTGSSRGLGWAMAQALAGAGAHVVLNGRDEAALKSRLDILLARGQGAEITRCDVSDATATAAAIHDTAAPHGLLDILVSNAATTGRKRVLEQTDEDWARVIETDLTSGFRMARE